jgi:precorrin-2/cobalt-factor-2 C20-methyltransferase
MNNTGKFYGIGVGPGDPDLLTLRAVKAFKSVDVVFEVVGPNTKKSVSGSVLDSLEIKADRFSLTFSMSLENDVRNAAIVKNAGIIAESLLQGKNCAFATIGDPMVYSTYIYILGELSTRYPELEVETIPGITSFQAAASISNFPLVEHTETLCVIPAFSEENLEKYPIDNADTIVFLKTYRSRNSILEILKKKGIVCSALYAARIGLDGELFCQDLNEIESLPEEYLSLLIVKK